MPAANFRDVRKYDGDSISIASIADAARALSFKIRSQDPENLTLQTGLNFWSFGERIVVAVERLGADCIVDISSTCALPTQFFDYGKNKRNVRQLFAKIEETAKQVDQSTGGLICHKCGYLLVGLEDGPCPECGNTLIPETSGYQDVSILRALRWIVIFVSFEYSVVIVLRLFGLGGFIPFSPRGLLFINVFTPTCILFFHFLAGGFRRRAERVETNDASSD